MEFEFDKEMDALLRQATRSGETHASEAAGAHLDADEISVFAENALSEKAKPRVINHLADCDRCRTILSNTIILNSEAAEKTAPAAVQGEENAVAAVSAVPWYKKLFSTRNLAFGLGTLVVVFAGMFGFLIVQRSLNSGAMDMAKVSEDSANTAAAPSVETADQYDGAANANTASNYGTERPGESESDPASAEETAEITANRPGGPNTGDTAGADKDNAPEGYSDRQKSDTLGRVAGEKQTAGNRPADERRRDLNQETETKLSEAESAASETTVQDVAPSRSAPPPPAPKATPSGVTASKPVSRSAGAGNARKKREEPVTTDSDDEKDASNDRAKESTTRNISGKKFTLKDRVWYDSQYRGQKTTNVRRNTEAYKKLDSGLRSISDRLGGTVVLVWKSKAYRIN